MNEQRVAEFINIFAELVETSSAQERTRIFPNLEVVDDTPADLGVNYILIEDDEGFYTPALKVPGVTYAVGDKVNVLFIKGTEPIAFQHGSGSGGGFVSGWPFADTVTADPTDPNADYSTITAAIAAIAVNDRIMIGSDFTEAIDIGMGMGLVGTQTGVTISQSATAFTVDINVSAAPIVYLDNLTISSAHTSGSMAAINISQSNVELHRVKATVITGSGSRAGIRVNNDNATLKMYDSNILVIGSGTDTYGILSSSGTGIFIDVYAGTTINVSGATNNYAIFAATGTTVRLHGCTIEAGIIGTSGSGTVTGHYVDATGQIIWLGGGVWLHRVDGLRIKQTDFPTAVAAASTNDTIVVYSGTYTLTTGSGGLEITPNGVKILGIGNVTITSAQTDVFTLDLRGDTITLENLTIDWTGTGSGGPIGTEGDNNRLINCRLNKTSGAATLSTGIWQYAGTGLALQDTFITVTAGTSKYAYYNTLATAAATIYGGSLAGDTADIFGNQSASTLALAGGVVLTNNLINYTGTLTGSYLSGGQLFTLPDSELGVRRRAAAFYTTIVDDFVGSALASAWAWASYGSMVTPGQVDLTSIPSMLVLAQTTSSSGPKSFLYRTDSITDPLFGFVMTLNNPPNLLYAGCRMDDGTDNNYVESLLRSNTGTPSFEFISRIRTGGLGVTTTVHATFTVFPQLMVPRLQNVGTQWSNWTALAGIGIDSPAVRNFTIGSGLTWTPVNWGFALFRDGTSPTTTFTGPYIDACVK